MKVITFEDNGQDFLWWTINAKGVVVKCDPCQEWLWKGTKVVNQPRTGRRLRIQVKLPKGSPVQTLRHRVISVKTVKPPPRQKKAG